MHICLSLSYSSLTRYVGSIEVTPWKGCGDCVCHTGFVRDLIVFADSWSAFVSSMAFFCFCVPFLLWNSRSSLHSLQASICRKSHSSHTFPFPSFHVSSQRSRSQIEHPSHAFHHPHSPILRPPVLYLDETKSPRFPPFFACSQIQISCE